MKVLTACLYSSGRISTLSTSFVSGVSACAKEKIAFAACAGHLIEIVRPSEAEGKFDVSFAEYKYHFEVVGQSVVVHCMKTFEE